MGKKLYIGLGIGVALIGGTFAYLKYMRKITPRIDGGIPAEEKVSISFKGESQYVDLRKLNKDSLAGLDNRFNIGKFYVEPSYTNENKNDKNRKITGAYLKNSKGQVEQSFKF